MIHLVKSSSVEFSFKYQYHHYGPYSAQVLAEQNFIEEIPESSAYISDYGRGKKVLNNAGDERLNSFFI